MHLSWRAAQDVAFLAQSRVTEVTVAYSIPIPLELLTTGLRIWVKLRGPGNIGLSVDDYLMVWATVSPRYVGQPFGLCETPNLTGLGMMITVCWSRSVRQWTYLRYLKVYFPRRQDADG
jgi:hypothetical protein